MPITVSVEVVPYGAGEGPYVAGMAIVRIDGSVFAKLRTQEKFEVVVPDPTFTTKTTDLTPPLARKESPNA